MQLYINTYAYMLQESRGQGEANGPKSLCVGEECVSMTSKLPTMQNEKSMRKMYQTAKITESHQ